MFVLPKKYAPSKRIEPGEAFEVVAEVRLGEDGRYVVGKLDGQELEDEAGEIEEPGETEEPGDEFDRMVRVPADGLEA